MSDNADYVRRMIETGCDDFHFTRVAPLLDERDDLAVENARLRKLLERCEAYLSKSTNDNPLRSIRAELGAPKGATP